MTTDNYIVEVTYGVHPNYIYATTPDREGAEKLRKTAKSLGYSDATVKPEAQFRKEEAERASRKADARRAARKAS
jgi:hypothetical protein